MEYFVNDDIIGVRSYKNKDTIQIHTNTSTVECPKFKPPLGLNFRASNAGKSRSASVSLACFSKQAILNHHQQVVVEPLASSSCEEAGSNSVRKFEDPLRGS